MSQATLSNNQTPFDQAFHAPSTRLAEDLQKQGFAAIKGSEYGLTKEQNHAFKSLSSYCNELPVDPTDPKRARHRRYRQCLMLSNGELNPLPLSKDPNTGELYATYSQSSSLNSEQNGTVRRFAPIDDALVGGFLASLVRADFRVLPKDFTRSKAGIYLVGIHLVSLRPNLGESAESSPNMIHRDGEPFTWVHLVSKSECTSGGESFVTATSAVGKQPCELADHQLFKRFELSSPLDSFVIDDALVAHHVSPVTSESSEKEANRTVALIDFTPLVPELV